LPRWRPLPLTEASSIPGSASVVVASDANVSVVPTRFIDLNDMNPGQAQLIPLTIDAAPVQLNMDVEVLDTVQVHPLQTGSAQSYPAIGSPTFDEERPHPETFIGNGHLHHEIEHLRLENARVAYDFSRLNLIAANKHPICRSWLSINSTSSPMLGWKTLFVT
jgi:hypothetical protein